MEDKIVKSGIQVNNVVFYSAEDGTLVYFNQNRLKTLPPPNSPNQVLVFKDGAPAWESPLKDYTNFFLLMGG